MTYISYKQIIISLLRTVQLGRHCVSMSPNNSNVYFYVLKFDNIQSTIVNMNT